MYLSISVLVKDLQLIKPCEQDDAESQGQLHRYLQHFVFITSHLLQTSIDSSFAEAVEATWVLSLALKGLYRTLKVQKWTKIPKASYDSELYKSLCGGGIEERTLLISDKET